MNKEWNKLEGVVGISIKTPKKYKVDFEEVNSFEDLKDIVQILYAGLPSIIDETCPFIEDI